MALTKYHILGVSEQQKLSCGSRRQKSITPVPTCCSPCVQISPFPKEASHIGLGPTLLHYAFQLSVSTMTLVPNRVTF